MTKKTKLLIFNNIQKAVKQLAPYFTALENLHGAHFTEKDKIKKAHQKAFEELKEFEAPYSIFKLKQLEGEKAKKWEVLKNKEAQLMEARKNSELLEKYLIYKYNSYIKIIALILELEVRKYCKNTRDLNNFKDLINNSGLNFKCLINDRSTDLTATLKGGYCNYYKGFTNTRFDYIEPLNNCYNNNIFVGDPVKNAYYNTIDIQLRWINDSFNQELKEVININNYEQLKTELQKIKQLKKKHQNELNELEAKQAEERKKQDIFNWGDILKNEKNL